ncbi:MAG: GNAT family N-acetyltransferase [Bacteroidetes bacterium]|nr:GNAT family N-acetyltransferase [Bacteroidota bacterium]HOA37084.1 GNAT family N-acetyltransferase [Flavihumibacter sp.]
MDIRFRAIKAADNQALASIIRNALLEFGAARPGTVYFDPTTDDLYALFQQARSAYFVAVDENNRVLGGAGIYPTPGLPEGHCELVKFYLLPAARGQGTGSALTKICLDTAATMGYTHVYLESLPELKKALRLYEREGFQYLTGPMGQSGHFGCDLWMLRAL